MTNISLLLKRLCQHDQELLLQGLNQNRQVLIKDLKRKEAFPFLRQIEHTLRKNGIGSGKEEEDRPESSFEVESESD